ncbi:uncharacterized protein abca12 [Genypterus blacodes]|uniref:uncharacterized protein abca12 n=1 Tax=Genypterus blacodes TaxID=154954 RepID=UPI003F75D59A
MAFIQQLRLLLWKNGLGVIRRPVWSLTLIIWPVIIFIIMAVTRQQFPADKIDACFVGPRNLPSTGFFPFLQTLLCNTDSSCHNKSRTSNSAHRSSTAHASRMDALPRDHLLQSLSQGPFSFSSSNNSAREHAALVEFLNTILGPVQQSKTKNNSLALMHAFNASLLGDQEDFNMDSVRLLKRFICNVLLPLSNSSSTRPLTSALHIFCKSNDTVLEVSLVTINNVLAELMMTKPTETMKAVGAVILVIDQLQRQTPVWESLLSIPQLFSPSSLDWVLGEVTQLLSTTQGALHFIQQMFPDVGAYISMVRPLLAGGTNLVTYIQYWPGKAVSIPLGDVVTLQNDSLSEAVKTVLRQVTIPLDKAIGLALDREGAHGYICNSSNNAMWLTAACATGTVDKLLGWISTDKVVKQALLAWSKHVASHDLVFAKGMLHSLMGVAGPGGSAGSNNTRTRRNVDVQPQTVEEDLFLSVGKVVMEITKNVPEVDMVVQIILSVAFESMKSVNVALQAVQEKLGNGFRDADLLRETLLMLLTNQSESNIWTQRLLNSMMQITMQSSTSQNLTCEDLLASFEWLLPTNSMTLQTWRGILCQNGTVLQRAVTVDLVVFSKMVEDILKSVQSQHNVTLPMILSEWHKLSNLSFGALMAQEVGGAGRMDWMPGNSTQNVTQIAQQSVLPFMVNFGVMLEKTGLWPQMKDLFHMAYWVLNYRPGITTQPANCSVDYRTLAIRCDTGLNWPQFFQPLLSLSPDVLLSAVKGTVSLLQQLFGGVLKHQVASYLQENIKGGDALSAFLVNLVNNLDGFVQRISGLDDHNTSNPAVMLPLLRNLMQSTGLGPLMPLFYGGGPLNASAVLDIVVKLGRLNQHIFAFNETDRTMPDLERLITMFLNLEGSLTVPVSLSMAHTYTDYFHPDAVAQLIESIKPFTNQTSSGLAESILSTLELVKSIADSPNGDPTTIILGYVQMLRQFLVSAYKLHRVEHLMLPGGQASIAQLITLQSEAMDFINLLSHESLQNLTQAGPDAAQNIIIQKFLAFLPTAVRLEAAAFLQDVMSLQAQVALCASGQDCLAAASEVFTFLDQISVMMLEAKGNVTINIVSKFSQQRENIATMIFSLLLSEKDAANVKTFRQALNFTRLVMAAPNVTVSHVQNALGQSGLTLQELDHIAALAGAANLSDLIHNLMEITKVQKCLDPQHSPVVTAQCVVGLINRLSHFLTKIPALRGQTAILSSIPIIINKTISDLVHTNFTSAPYMSVTQTLNSTLASIKMNLQRFGLNTSEIMNEIRTLERLLNLAANHSMVSSMLNSTLLTNPMQAQKVYMEIAAWYLNRLENVTSNGSLAELLHPLFRLAEMQLAQQLAQTDFSLFVSEKIEHLMANLQHPLDGAGVNKVGQTTIQILRRLIHLIKIHIESQNNSYGCHVEQPLCNNTVSASLMWLIDQYLDGIQMWMNQTNTTVALANILQWGNSSVNGTNPGRDLHFLLQAMKVFFTEDQLFYLSAIDNITQHLSKALMAAAQPGGLQSEHFPNAVLEAVQSAMQVLTAIAGPLPLSVSQDILGIVQDSLKLILRPDLSYASARNISLLILKRAKSIVQQTLPQMLADYLLGGIQAAITYFEDSSTVYGPDTWNYMILSQMKVIQSLLPPNCTAQPFISVLINTTKYILESGQGNMSLWEILQNASEENAPTIFKRVAKLLNMLLPHLMGDPGLQINIPPLKSFADLVSVLDQIITAKANQSTWHKLEKLLTAFLSTVKGTPLWHEIPRVAALLERFMGAFVHNMGAENALIQSLQKPLLTLMSEIVLSVNSSQINLTALSEEMQRAIEHTIEAVQQANGTLPCHKAIKLWEPVREAARLSNDTLSRWCNISLRPVIEANAAYGNLNISHIDVGPATLNATAERIVRTLRSLYEVYINRTYVTEQLIMAFAHQLSNLGGQQLSHEAQLHWHMQLQQQEKQDSLEDFRMASEALLSVAPHLRPYMEAIERALVHFLNNYSDAPDNMSSQDLYRDAAMIFLASLNLTSEDIYSMMRGNSSELDVKFITDLIIESVKLMADLKIFGDETIRIDLFVEEVLTSNFTRPMLQKVAGLVAWFCSPEASGMQLITEGLPKIFDVVQSCLTALAQITQFLPHIQGPLGQLLVNIAKTVGVWGPLKYHLGLPQDHVRYRREVSMKPLRGPVDDFIDLFYIDYPTLLSALAVPPTSAEILETAHVFLSNPDLGVVIKGVTYGPTWGRNATREDTVDATLGVLSYFTAPNMLEMSSMEFLRDAVSLLPDDFPFAAYLKNFTRGLVNQSQENLALLHQTFQTGATLLHTNLTDDRFPEIFGRFRSQVCDLERKDQIVAVPFLEQGQLCDIILPGLQILIRSLRNMHNVTEALFQTIIGNPNSYNVQRNWTSGLNEGFHFNTSRLSNLDINITSLGLVTVGGMLRNKTAFLLDVQQHMDLDPKVLHLLTETTLPKDNLKILSWLVNLRHCTSRATLNMTQAEVTIYRMVCSMSPQEWYILTLLTARHLNVEKLIYRMVLSEELQSLVGVLLQMAQFLVEMMNKLLPAIDQLQSYLVSINELNLGANSEFSQMARGQRSTISNKATFLTLSRALCSNGILALLGIGKLSISESNPSMISDHRREELIERFKIPRNATPFCTNLYLDMVNTTGGAIAWAFLKPMLMGQILFTPDTPITRDLMEKANYTLQEFADLKQYSEDWIESSSYVIKAAQILTNTMPMLQNSLSVSFVKDFIEMQTNIDVANMKETLNIFSNMTELLERNKHILKQITTLSTLMVRFSSCIKFDRYRAYDSEDQLNVDAQTLAKERNLYASVIFKIPKVEDSSRKRRSTSSLPPKVSYTIRMHTDNVMRTDRIRTPFYVKDSQISASKTLRYNRGFIYLQENIDRAIIETQTGQKLREVAVQLQPFPYPCHHKDEYMNAVSVVFPIMLMTAWVLFVADFVKKLVHERELRLHEYMKMMGVNPLSHFFAWFVECASYLLLTIIILTLLMKHGLILANSDGFLLFLFFCDYGLSILAFSYLVSSFFDKTYIAGLSGSLLYILCFFPFIVVMSMEQGLSLAQKSALSLFSPTCFSYASQYISRYEAQGEGIQWSNSYISPIAADTASFGWLCWMMVIDSILYFIIGGYIRMVFPGKYGIPAPWYFPFKASFWKELCCITRRSRTEGRGLLFTNFLQRDLSIFNDDKGKGEDIFSPVQAGEDFSRLPVGVGLHGLTKIYGDRVAIQNLNVSFYEGHVTSLLGHNGAGKTTTMSLLTGLFAPSSGTIEVYGRDMQDNIDDVRRELGVCMQYDVLFDHMTAKEHLLLYGQIKAPNWSRMELREQIRSILEETDMYAHRHKRVGTLSGGMRRKLSISIAFIGGSRLVVLDEPTTGVDPCSRRSIWDIVIQNKKSRTIIMSTHHLDEAEVLSDRIALLERGGLKCCGSPFHLKDKLGQGYKLTLTKKTQNTVESAERVDNAQLKDFIRAHIPEAHLKEAQGSDLVYSLPPFTSVNASAYRSLLTALDANLDSLQLGCYGISDTTLEEVFLQLTNGSTDSGGDDGTLSISENISDTGSIDSYPENLDGGNSSFGDKITLSGSSTVSGMALLWQQIVALMIKRFHHSRRNWKGMISQILLPVLFVVFSMGMGSIKKDIRHYPDLELSPALYNIGPSYSFFSNQNPNASQLEDVMMSFPGMDNTCIDKPDKSVCTRSSQWTSKGNSTGRFSVCRCTQKEQICSDHYQPPHKQIPSSQTVYNLTGFDMDNYLVATANDFIRNRYGGFVFGMPLPAGLQMDLKTPPKNRTLSKVYYNPEGFHTMPAYLNSLNNLILRSNLPADKDPRKYAISVSSHPYFGRVDEEDAIIQGILQILIAMCVITGYAITTASFAVYEVHEHHSSSKRLQHIAGISESLYWTFNFFYDMLMYMIPVTLTVAVIAAFQVPAFTERQNLAAVTLLLVLFGFATFPWMYLLSGVFRDPESAFIIYVCINLFISINTVMTTSILFFLKEISVQQAEAVGELFKRLCGAFLIFPQFSFGHGLMELARKNIEVQILSDFGVDAYRSPFSMDTFGWIFLSSFIHGLVFFSLRLILNKSLLRKVRHAIMGRKKVPEGICEDEDEDVVAEHDRVTSGAASSDILQVNQLTKIYQHLKKKMYAVKRLSVGIPAGECFGLLGVNGAGKTTTFKMLTGDISPTDGTAQIRDYDGRIVDIMECRNKGISIGYCPQVDALDNLLTGEEHLYFYARIHGIAKRNIDGVVNYLLRRLELEYHRNNIADDYSCGTRRKLSTALALIGHPQILLLDEPSSGMDPRTKRHLWKIISEEVKGKCAVVLTSHSMEECEALCSRLAIMVKGQFRCLGSLQHIKNRFGSGCTVKMYLAQASCNAEAITAFMQLHFPSTYLKDQHSTMLEYHIPVAPGGVADIFNQLESNKSALQIKHFSVSQTTLDEVFINFAMGRVGMETIPVDEDNGSLSSA